MRTDSELQAHLDEMLRTGGIFIRVRDVGDGQATIKVWDTAGNFQVVCCVPPPGRRRAWTPARIADAARSAIEALLLQMEARRTQR